MNRSIPAPISFVVAAIIFVALFIFFGAWAVSVDAQGREDALSLAFVGPGATLISQEKEKQLPVMGQTEDGWKTGFEELEGSSADTWWGRGLLQA